MVKSQINPFQVYHNAASRCCTESRIFFRSSTPMPSGPLIGDFPASHVWLPVLPEARWASKKRTGNAGFFLVFLVWFIQYSGGIDSTWVGATTAHGQHLAIDFHQQHVSKYSSTIIMKHDVFQWNKCKQICLIAIVAVQALDLNLKPWCKRSAGALNWWSCKSCYPLSLLHLIVRASVQQYGATTSKYICLHGPPWTINRGN